jgi:hypothetical protein
MNWKRRVIDLMNRNHISFREACRLVGQRGGQAAAANARKRRWEAEQRDRESERQQCIGIA